jgi:hypothetical protein
MVPGGASVTWNDIIRPIPCPQAAESLENETLRYPLPLSCKTGEHEGNKGKRLEP